MRPLTVYRGKLLGLFTLITSFWLLAERQTAVSTIPALLADRPAMVIFASITLAGGLAIVLAHNIWSGGVLPIVVTLIEWVMVIRGVLFRFLPPEATLHILAAICNSSSSLRHIMWSSEFASPGPNCAVSCRLPKNVSE